MAAFRQLNLQESGALFPTTPHFRLVRLGEKDARRVTDDVRTLKNLIVSCEDMYPSIDRWFDNKVIPGLRMCERVAYVAYEGESPIASAVLKRGARSKFCHLRIADGFQDLDLGQMFFTQMTLEARKFAKEVHFTLPESLWCARRPFFEAFGFGCATRAGRQYRAGDPELACSAPLDMVWRAALGLLPQLMSKFAPGGFSLDNRILISVRPKHLDRIIAGTKVVEIRRRFSGRWLGCRAVLYGSHPVKSLLGEATIYSIAQGSPEEIWSRYRAQICADSDEFEKYTNACREVSAIELRDVAPYIVPMPLEDLSRYMQANLRPPMSFCDVGLTGSSAWSSAIAVASLLQGRFRCTRRP
ncbi:MAG: hypothetical protein ACLQPN_14025 [Bryobacteraceae bacterium]